MGYTYLDAKNPNGSVEIRRPKHELAIGATLQTFGGRGSVSADLRHVAGNFDTQFFGGFSTVEMPDITTVDIALDYSLSDALTLEARVQNLFDAEASEVWGYAGQPREITVGVMAAF
jgi:vitamin B12 transporter